MIVRFGFVAMALNLQNASPSKTITLTNFQKIADKEAARNKVRRTAEDNLHHTLRILRYAVGEEIHVYRFSSKLIPLFGHPVTAEVNIVEELRPQFEEIGAYVKEHSLRVSFHPDHFTLLNSPKEDVLERSIEDLNRHCDMLDAMGLDDQAKLNIHVGGAYGDKEVALRRLVAVWHQVPSRVQQRIIFENDDKTYTARDTLRLCQELQVPMTLDVHHHNCNHAPGEEELRPILKDIFATWASTGIVPKVHMSSPRDEKNARAHADFIDKDALCHFLDNVHAINTDIDVMLEAKKKDQALLQLMSELRGQPNVEIVDGGTIRYTPY